MATSEERRKRASRAGLVLRGQIVPYCLLDMPWSPELADELQRHLASSSAALSDFWMAALEEEVAVTIDEPSPEPPGDPSWLGEGGDVVSGIVYEWQAQDASFSLLLPDALVGDDTDAFSGGLSELLFPESLALASPSRTPVEDLANFTTSFAFGGELRCRLLTIDGPEGERIGHGLLVGPVIEASTPQPEPSTARAEVPQPPAAPSAAPPPAARHLPLLGTILHLPVTLVVELARKRIGLSQMLAIAPGALITFDKSCDGALEMRVNNEVYCHGEAVKIGEKFGLKIDGMGPSEESRRQLTQPITR